MLSLVQPHSIDPNKNFIGTPEKKTQAARGQYQHRRNETPSLIDHIHPNLVTQKMKTLTPQELIALYEPMIEQHIERRIAIFFQQLVVCYCTRLHFEIGDTTDQGESAPGIKILKDDGTTERFAKRNAAHSSTIPSLIAFDLKKWEKAKKKRQALPEGFVYIKDSDTYRTSNSTLDMPEEINQADIAIDGKKANSLLRTQALELLNQAALGKIDPQKGLIEFMTVLEQTVSEQIGRQKKEAVNLCLQSYLKYITMNNKEIQVGSKTFDYLLGIKTDHAHSAKIRKMVLGLRYQAIRDSQLAQSEIMQKITQVKNRILKTFPKKPRNFEDAFRHSLYTAFFSDEDRESFSKLLNYSHASSVPKDFKASLKKVNKYYKLIQDLALDLRITFKYLQKEELLKRGTIVKAVREAKTWTQEKLANKVKKLFPQTPSSQSTISRIENNIKLVDSNYANELSKVLDVDPALFMPAFFYS